MVNQPNVVVMVESQNEQVVRAGEELARRLGLVFASRASFQPPNEDDRNQLLLVLNDDWLELRDDVTKPGRGLIVDFTSLHPQQAARRGGFSRKQPLARAIGKLTQTVLDATAGLGHDAALLACMGYRVLAVERSPIIAALLQDGLRRAELNAELREALGAQLQIINADARDVISGPRAERWNLPIDNALAIYIDPMFPPKRKVSALAKKSIRLVREVVGEDEDAAVLLRAARSRAHRVVVKRPTYAPPLAEKPTMSITGKLVRYDVYVQAPSQQPD